MLDKLKQNIDGMSRPGKWSKAQLFFVKAVYIWFLINVVLIWNDKDYIWGPEAVLMRTGGSSTWITNLAYALIFKPSLFHWIFPIHIISIIASLFDKSWSFIPRTLVWVTGILLYFAGYNAFNAGFILMNLLAFFTIPFYSKAKHPVRHIMNHIAIWGAQLQVILVYGSSALYKLNGDSWRYGEAVYYTLSNPRFSSNYILNSGILHSILLMKASSYLALVYQIIFPIGVWIKKWKRPLLYFGIVFHLTIGIVMNLWDFSLAMIASYFVFFKD